MPGYVYANRSGKATPNDVVLTPVPAANFIVEYLLKRGLSGNILEPCRASEHGSFYSALKGIKNSTLDWCEIEEGKDFFEYNSHVDWIVTNPPYSIYDDFLLKSLEVANNVVFLCPLNKVFKSKKLDIKLHEWGGLKEIIMMGSGGSLGWPFGFPCGVLWFKKDYHGPVDFTRAYDWSKK